MLVVKPNPRRMRYMRDSPSEGMGGRRGRGLIERLRWERVLLAAGVVGVVIVGLIALSHY
jgi:hypothetical protein